MGNCQYLFSLKVKLGTNKRYSDFICFYLYLFFRKEYEIIKFGLLYLDYQFKNRVFVNLFVTGNSLRLGEYHLHKDSQNKVPTEKSIKNSTQLYKKDSVIQAEISQIIKSNPSTIKQFTCQNDQNYKFLVIQNSQNKSNRVKEPKKEIIITCNVHARQLFVTEVCLDFISKISQKMTPINKTLNSSKQKTTFEQQESSQFSLESIDQLLDRARVTIFYRGNDNRDKVIQGQDYCIRKDKNRIDINRNFPTNFNIEKALKNSEEYPGDFPLSESFSKCLDNELSNINKSSKIDIFIDIHTGQFTLDNSFEKWSLQRQNNRSTIQILQRVKQKYCKQCRMNSLGDESDDQVTNGEIFTDVKKRYNADHSVLLQIYGGYNDHLDAQQNCIAIFNPLTEKELSYYKNIWTNALFYFIKQT